MKISIKLLFITAIFVGGFLLWKVYDPFSPLPLSQPTSVKPVEDSSSKTKYPVTTSPESATDPSSGDEPIPKLDESDKSLRQKAPGFFNKADFEAVVIFENFIRHFAVAIENAEGTQIPVSQSPIKTAPGELLVTKLNGHLVLSEKNYQRYQIYINLAQAADLKKIVGYYRRVYPLFQSAYKDLGVPGNFNDKLIEVIDSLLATPDIKGPMRVTHPSLRYEFEDPNLESLSAIQKILLRMGPDNSRILKSKFKELREMLSHLSS